MKTLFALTIAICLMTSCSRSGTTIANDDSVFDNGNTPVATTERIYTEYPISEKSVPQPVRDAFYARYSSPQNVQWVYVSTDGTYKVSFFIGKIKWESVYAPDGTLISESHL